MATSFSVGTSADFPLGANFARDVIRVGVIGYGYWGPNIVRNFQGHEKADVVAVCDKNPKSLSRVRRAHPEVPVTSDQMDVLRSTQVDVVAVVTPVWTHFELAKLALENGKHVFVEKPFTCTAAQAEQLIELADRKNLKIMVDHTFLFTGAVKRIRQVIDDGTLGDLYYYDSTRVNLGLFQHDVNVIWDLAVHDLAILDFLLDASPTAISANGANHVTGGPDNMAYITLYFDSGTIAHVNVNWLAPVKVRQTLIGGSRRMIVYDDLQPSEKVKIYDRGVNLTANENDRHKMLVSYRVGDMWGPELSFKEALITEIEHFTACIRQEAV